MFSTAMLSVLLMLGGFGAPAASDFHVFGKSLHDDESLQSSSDDRHSVRKQLAGGLRRSLDLESFKVHVTPSTSKIRLPTIIKLYPPTAKPLHMHANMPLRFGRGSDPGDERLQRSSPNLPQRFGRAWEMIQMCGECREVRDAPSPVLPQRFGRDAPYWSLLRTLASEQLLDAGLHWADDFNFKPSSDEDGEMDKGSV